MAAAVYRAREKCRVGHLRLPGEIFSWEEFETTPGFLERLEDGMAEDPERLEETAPAPSAYPMPEDLEMTDPGTPAAPDGKKTGRKQK